MRPIVHPPRSSCHLRTSYKARAVLHQHAELETAIDPFHVAVRIHWHGFRGTLLVRDCDLVESQQNWV